MLDMMSSSFIDDVSGGNNSYVDGLMYCTESLGFESSDERRDVNVDDRIIMNRIDEEFFNSMSSSCNSTNLLLAPKKQDYHHQVIKKKLDDDHRVNYCNNYNNKFKFPPPLSSLAQDGRPTFFLRPVRGDGRLMLTEVKIVRPEILRASRQDGRLKLHLVQEDDDDDVDDNDGSQEEEEEEIMEDNERENEEEEEEEIDEEGWQFSETVTSGGGGGGSGDGGRRCYEQVGHHDQHVWRQHCLTIR